MGELGRRGSMGQRHCAGGCRCITNTSLCGSLSLLSAPQVSFYLQLVYSQPSHNDDTTFTHCELRCRSFGPAAGFPLNNFLEIALVLGLSTTMGRASTRTPTVTGTSGLLAVTYNINSKSDSSNSASGGSNAQIGIVYLVLRCSSY